MRNLHYIAKEALRRMYRESLPTANYDKLVRSPEVRDRNWYLRYYLSNGRQLSILSEVAKEYGLTSAEKLKLDFMVLMGNAPSNARTSYEENILYGRKVCRGCIYWRNCPDRRDYIVYCSDKKVRDRRHDPRRRRDVKKTY
jgi:hypothetical protein